jgi:hypothetical protein
MTGTSNDLQTGEPLEAVMRTGPIAVSRVLDIAVQAAAALSSNHAGGLVHGSLTSTDILLERNGRVKILNPGDHSSCMPQDDQQALGRILKAALQGHPNHPIDWVIDRLLAEDPEDRYASTRDLYLELRALRDRVPATPLPAITPDIWTATKISYSWRPFIAVPLTLLSCAIFVFYLMTHTPLPKRGQTPIHSFPVWSPDGRRILFVKSVSGVNQVFLQEFPTVESLQLTHAAQSCADPRWSPDGNTLAYRRAGKWWTGPAEPDRQQPLPEPPAPEIAMPWLGQ